MPSSMHFLMAIGTPQSEWQMLLARGGVDKMMHWSMESLVSVNPSAAQLLGSIDEMVSQVAINALPEDKIVIMSNGSFGGVHQKLLAKLEADAKNNV